jgi:hypothetical protein
MYIYSTHKCVNLDELGYFLIEQELLSSILFFWLSLRVPLNQETKGAQYYDICVMF